MILNLHAWAEGERERSIKGIIYDERKEIYKKEQLGNLFEEVYVFLLENITNSVHKQSCGS